MYKMAFFKEPRFGSVCHGWEKYRVQVQQPSIAGHLIDHLAWRFPFVVDVVVF